MPQEWSCLRKGERGAKPGRLEFGRSFQPLFKVSLKWMKLDRSLRALLNIGDLWTVSLNKDLFLVGECKPIVVWKQTFVWRTKLFFLVYKNTHTDIFLLIFSVYTYFFLLKILGMKGNERDESCPSQGIHQLIPDNYAGLHNVVQTAAIFLSVICFNITIDILNI